MTSPRSPILTPWSPVLGPMPAVIEDYLFDQNLGSHTTQPLYSPRKAKPTTQLSLEVPASNKHSSSSAPSSLKSSNGFSTKMDMVSETEEEVSKDREGGSVDEILINLMNRSSGGGTSSGKGKGIDILNGEEQLYFTAEPENETFHDGAFYGTNIDKGAGEY